MEAKGRCVDLLEKSHGVVNVTIFMSVFNYVVHMPSEGHCF